MSAGSDKVAPAHSMWPLVCNEIGLSYEQEEKVRLMQRALVRVEETWVDRHTGRASSLVMDSVHQGLQNAAQKLTERERRLYQVLSPVQRVKFLQWTHRNKERLRQRKMQEIANKVKTPEAFEPSPHYHTASNLYILHHRLQQVQARSLLPTAMPIISKTAFRKLGRRPAFESLGHVTNRDIGGMDGNSSSRSLSRDYSFASSGSLKRSASQLSMDSSSEHAQKPSLQVSPEHGEAAAKAYVEQRIGHVRPIIPNIPPPLPVANYRPPPAINIKPATSSSPVTVNAVPPASSSSPDSASVPQPMTITSGSTSIPLNIPAPTPVQYLTTPVAPTIIHHHHYNVPPPPAAPVVASTTAPSGATEHHFYNYAPPPSSTQAPPPVPETAPVPDQHKRQSSFLPPLAGGLDDLGDAGDFFVSLMEDTPAGEDDWAIGEGIDMDDHHS